VDAVGRARECVRDTLPTACGASMWYGRQTCVQEHPCIYRRPHALDGENIDIDLILVFQSMQVILPLIT